MLVQEAASELIEMLLDVGEDQIAPKGFKCFLIQCIHYRLNGSYNPINSSSSNSTYCFNCTSYIFRDIAVISSLLCRTMLLQINIERVSIFIVFTCRVLGDSA